MKKIILYMPNFKGGGAERVMLNLAASFQNRGLDVTVLVDRHEGAYKNSLPSGIAIDCLNVAKSSFSLPKLVKFLNAAQPDIVLSALPINNLNACMAKRLCRKPFQLIISDHGMISTEIAQSSILKRVLLPFCIKKLYPLADHLVCASSGIKTDMQTVFGLRLPIRVIDNPVLPENWEQAYTAPLPLPHLQHLLRPVVLSVGRLTASKNYGLLLHAFAAFRARYGGSLLIIGEGEERARLLDLAQKLDIKAEVHLPGFIQPIFPVYAFADMFVLSSDWEGFGNVLVEAMAASIPVISTDCPAGPRYILADGLFGDLVPMHDAALLAKALERGLTPSAERLNAAKNRAMDFTSERISKEYGNLFKD
jgi:glycosyltransferase involved in cell wall biosynthesis